VGKKKNKSIDPESLSMFGEVVAEYCVENELDAGEFLDDFEDACDDDDQDLAWYVGWLSCAAEVMGMQLEELLTKLIDELPEEEENEDDEDDEDDADDEDEDD